MPSNTDYQNMLIDPERFFHHPDAVVDDTELNRSQKLKILQTWQNIEEELQTATAENMAGGEADKLDEVNRAINRLRESEACSGNQ